MNNSIIIMWGKGASSLYNGAMLTQEKKSGGEEVTHYHCMAAWERESMRN